MLIGTYRRCGPLVPLAPRGSLDTTVRPAVPHFITSGAWRGYVAEGRTLVPVPLDSAHAIRRGPTADFGFAVPLGYFIGPTSDTDRRGFWGARRRPTTVALSLVISGKDGGMATPAERHQAVADARFWRADAFVLESDPREAALRQWLDDCFGAADRRRLGVGHPQPHPLNPPPTTDTPRRGTAGPRSPYAGSVQEVGAGTVR